MNRYLETREALQAKPKTWLVTGVAGFIGSHLLQELLSLGQTVVGIDNFSTGFQSNLDEVQELAGDRRGLFTFIQGDIRNPDDCRKACQGVDITLHQAALGSVPRSIKDPIASHQSNVDGFLNILVASREAGVEQMVYASSSSVYGDDPTLPKIESRTGKPLSPYALTKSIGEQYAAVFGRVYDYHPVGLRYFNVFGPRQNPHGPYAAVIPRWMAALAQGEDCVIFGDGTTSRDFCYVANAVQANILAGCCPKEARGGVFNVSCGTSTSLNQLYAQIMERILLACPGASHRDPRYEAPREGDIRHSLADLSQTRTLLGYEPTHQVPQGLDVVVPSFLKRRKGD